MDQDGLLEEERQGQKGSRNPIYKGRDSIDSQRSSSQRFLYDKSDSRSEGGSSRNLLEAKKDKLNTVFGVRPWANPVSQQPVKSMALIKLKEDEEPVLDNFCTFGNTLWVVLFGWWIAVPFLFAAAILFLSYVGRKYAIVCMQIMFYLFWPFGKYIVMKASDSEIPMSEEQTLITPGGDGGNKFVYFLWLTVASIFVFPFLLIGTALNWFFVVPIPMAKVLWTLTRILFRQPTNLTVIHNYNRAQSFTVLLCTYRAFNVLYFEYEVKGVNIVFLNLIPVVLARVLMILILHLTHHEGDDHIIPPVLQFFVNILCSIPITFYIGTSIASIACQTNYTIGAILNATFGSVTELILFTLALTQGELDDLILFSLTGSLLCDMLLLPGMAMIAGGIKFKEQQFSSSAAAISSLLLFVAVIGAFTPTMFYHLFGMTSTACETCILERDGNSNNVSLYCLDCRYGQDNVADDPMWHSAVKNLLYLSCGVLPVTYLIGLFFTFKTHTHIFDEEDEEEGNAEWSIPFSVGVMLISVSCFGLLAEDLVNLIQDVLEELSLNQAFLGVTVIALTPAATEIANAIKFALSNQISLSVSIGSASSIQVALIQMPSLVLLAGIMTGSTFHLIFPLMSVFAVILAVFTFNYISQEGKTNYFVGSTMVIMYVLLIASFYFIPDRKSLYPGKHVTPTPPPPHYFEKRLQQML